MPGEEDQPAEPEPGEEQKTDDNFENFNLAAKKIPAAADTKLDDFDIDGIIKKDEKQAAAAAGRDKQKPFEISEGDLEKLMATLEGYPLNIRIACEEAIAEEVLEPDNLNGLVKLLVAGAGVGETAKFLNKFSKHHVIIPKSYKTGAELEAEQQSFLYIFRYKLLPIIRLCFMLVLLAASVTFLSYQFIYKPLKAASLYSRGYELIPGGDENSYNRANGYFEQASSIHREKDWYYKYAEAFRDEKQFLFAEDKYDQLLDWYPGDKKGILDYALLEKDYLFNYEKADKLIRERLLNYKIDDKDGLLALGDVNLDWGETDPARYEQARECYARYLTFYGGTDPVWERMLLYFIRTDKLAEVIPLQKQFMSSTKTKISPETLAELGGYLLDKRMEVPKGIPDANIEKIEGIKAILLRAEAADPMLPEPHYQLARYYNFYNSYIEERETLERAKQAFNAAKKENRKRIEYRIDTQRMLGALLIRNREYIQAEQELADGIEIYENALSRRLVSRGPQFGKLYADVGDIEYFVKEGNMAEAARYYIDSRENDYFPPEIEYRLGATYFKREDYPSALKYFFDVSTRTPFNRNLLNSLALTSYLNHDYYAAESYYKRLIDMLNSDRNRIPAPLPDDNPQHKKLLERIMQAENNMGVTMNSLAAVSGKSAYRTQAMAMFADAGRVSDLLGRNPTSFTRSTLLSNPGMPEVSVPYLNMRNTLYPIPGAQDLIFPDIDADVLEPSPWEQ